MSSVTVYRYTSHLREVDFECQHSRVSSLESPTRRLVSITESWPYYVVLVSITESWPYYVLIGLILLDILIGVFNGNHHVWSSFKCVQVYCHLRINVDLLTDQSNSLVNRKSFVFYFHPHSSISGLDIHKIVYESLTKDRNSDSPVTVVDHESVSSWL